MSLPIALLAVLAGCVAVSGPAPARTILVGQVDPERIAPAPAVEPGFGSSQCGLRQRVSLPINLAVLPLVTARINGQPATLVLDTGAESTILTANAAKRLGVTSSYDFLRSMNGIGGAVATGDARLGSMSLGGVALSFPRALVGHLAFKIGGVDVDGLLGASLLGDFDLDLDVPHRRVDLYDRSECAGARPAWGGRYVALATTRSLSGHPFFPIMVNGHTLMATLDSGAERTVVSLRAAAMAGIGPDSLVRGAMITARGAAGETLPATAHAVDVRVAGVPLRSPVIVTAAGFPRDIDALLGLDFLLDHRVWLSYGSRRIFILAP